jgi:hypothetical protein
MRPVRCLSGCLITPNVKNPNWEIVYACVAQMSTNDTATGRSRLLAPDGSVSRGRDIAVVRIKRATRDTFMVKCIRKH